MSPEVMKDNGQTVQTIMDKTFVCLCAQWHAWARGRGQLKIQTVFVLNFLCKSCEQWCLQYVTLVHNHSHAYRAWLFVRTSCELFCASCAQLLARFLCSIICTMSLPCTSTTWLIYKLAFYPIYNENLYSLSMHTSFVNSAKAYLVHMVAVRSGDLGQVLVQPSNNQTLSPMHWWALVWPFDGQSSCFL